MAKKKLTHSAQQVDDAVDGIAALKREIDDLPQGSTTMDAKVAKNAAELSQLALNINSITLGVHDDGLVYIFMNGLPFGTGIQFGSVESLIFGFKYDINHFIHYGQSLSQGDWETRAISTVQKNDAIMFSGGIRVWESRDQDTKYSSFVPAVESVFKYNAGETIVGASVRGETPCVGTSDMFMQLVDGEKPDNFQILLSAPGMGGTSISQLSDKTGIYYKRLLDDVRNGKRLAQSQNKTYACVGVSWIQGENDFAMKKNDYYNAMRSLFVSLNSDIKAITGQKEDVQFLLYQTDSCDHYLGSYSYPYVSLAQLQIANDMKNVHMATPITFLPKMGDSVHLTAEGSRIMGGYFGIALKKAIIDGKKFSPITLSSYTIEGNNVLLKFNVPNPPLVIDSELVPDRGVGKGFQFRNVTDTGNNIDLGIIKSVEILDGDVVKISCTKNPANKKLTYSVSNRGDNVSVGGNLRDSQNIKFKVDENTNYNMYNWCPIFDVVLVGEDTPPDPSTTYIEFEDNNVKNKLLSLYDLDADGEISIEEAGKIISFGNIFDNDTSIVSFNELEYFTNLHSISEANYGFANCSNLVSVNLKNITLLNNAVFSNCPKLNSLGDTSNIESIGTNAFSGTAIKEISLPKCKIIPQAFYDCNDLKTIYAETAETLSGTLNLVEDFVAPELKEIVVNKAFYNGKLKAANYPKCIKLSNQTFVNCTMLSYVVIGDVSIVDIYTFFGCSALKYVKMNTTSVPTLANANAFGGTTCLIYVPDNLVSEYKSADKWSAMADRIKGFSEFTE